MVEELLLFLRQDLIQQYSSLGVPTYFDLADTDEHETIQRDQLACFFGHFSFRKPPIPTGS